MADTAHRIQAYLVLREGMRLYYDCPRMSTDDFRADNFFRKYRGKTAVIKGFPRKLVGPLDRKGRLPGTYFSSKGINVQFEGEDAVHEGLYSRHFVVIDRTETVTYEEHLASLRAADLPHPLEFYPGDVVYKTDDLLQTRRTVVDVKFDDNGVPRYTLAESAESKEQRAAAKAAKAETEKPERSDLFALVGFDFPKTESCSGKDLRLLEKGKVHVLYTDPTSLSFGSAQEELAFWSQDGLSRTLYASGTHLPSWEWPLGKARSFVESSRGDLIVASRQVSRRSTDPTYVVRILHECFAAHRERVRELALATTPPQERETSSDDLLSTLAEE